MTDDQSTAVVTAPEQTTGRPDVEAGPLRVDHVVVEDLLVEEVSIDGMCGVY